jgi:hypothetical protein
MVAGDPGLAVGKVGVEAQPHVHATANVTGEAAGPILQVTNNISTQRCPEDGMISSELINAVLASRLISPRSLFQPCEFQCIGSDISNIPAAQLFRFQVFRRLRILY